MRVISGGAAGAAAAGGGRKAEAATGFRVGGTPAPATPAAVAAARPAEPAAGLLALQSVPDPAIGRRKALRRGGRLLDDLAALRTDLLGGRVPADRLTGLRDRLRAGDDEAGVEPGLAAVLGEIALRVEVELAKLGMADA